MSIIKVIEETLTGFCKEYIADPYLCYTEHGQHALYFTELYNALPENERYVSSMLPDEEKIKICRIQKEYPTHDSLGKSKRQNWDISVIKNPVEVTKKKHPFDYLKLEAAIEFGLNSRIDHLVDDFLRLSHSDTNADHRCVVHLYRLSEAGNQISARDWSANAKDFKEYIKTEKLIKILKTLSTGNADKIKEELKNLDDSIKQKIENYEDRLKEITSTPVTFFLGYVDFAGKPKPLSALYKISEGKSETLSESKP